MRPVEAVKTFNEGFNCCQALLSAFHDMTDIDSDTALKLGTAFGAGIAYRGEVCGAVSGAIMIISLLHGRTSVNDEDAKLVTNALTERFLNEFKRQKGSHICKDLLGEDPSTESGKQRIEEKDLFNTVCPRVVETAAVLLDNLLSK